MDRRAHWNQAWSTRSPERVSWYQDHAEPSLRLIAAVTTPRDGIIDVGGGASVLARELLDRGYVDVTVLDVSLAALDVFAKGLGDRAAQVRRLEGDVLEYPFSEASFALWHDRAVFHFLTEPEDRERYRDQLARAVRPGGHAVVGTFASDGPTQCSGLPVQRYDVAALMAELGANWRLVEEVRQEHQTPSGAVQPFTFVLAARLP